MRLSRLFALTTAFGALAAAVQAQTVTPMTVKDGNGNSQTLCEYKPDGTNLAGCAVQWLWNGSAWVLVPTGAGAAAGAARTVVAQDGSTVAGSAPGAAGSPSSQVVTVQGAPGMTALASKPQDSGGGDATDPVNHAVKVTLQAANVTQPVSGALSASGGWTPKLLNALSATIVQVKASAGQLGMLQCYNPNASQIYVQLLDSASPTLGSTTPVLSIPIAPAATGGAALDLVGMQFANAIAAAATTTATGSTAPATAPDCNVVFK